MRSINTSLIALLPVAGLLFVGAGLLGVGTIKDLALILFVGIASGAYSSLFLATPIVVDLTERQPAYQALARRVAAKRAAEAQRAEAAAGVISSPPRRVERRSGQPRPRVRARARTAARNRVQRDRADRRRRRRRGPVHRQSAARRPRLSRSPASCSRTSFRCSPMARRSRPRSRRWPTSPARRGRSISSPASRRAASSSPPRWPANSAAGCCRSARPASCRRRRCAGPTHSSTARPRSRCRGNPRPGAGCSWSMTCSPPAARWRRRPSCSLEAGAELAGIATVLRAGLPRRAAPRSRRHRSHAADALSASR